VSAYAAYRFEGYYSDDSERLTGMNRDDGADGRIALTWRTGAGAFTLELGSEISGESDGWNAQVRWGDVFSRGNFRYRPWIGFGYEDANLTVLHC